MGDEDKNNEKDREKYEDKLNIKILPLKMISRFTS